MNTYDVLSAGVADCSRSVRNQPTAPGNSLKNQPSVSSSLLLMGRDVGEGKCYSLEAELQVLGCILLDASVAFNILGTKDISPHHFYDLRNRELFQLLQEMNKRGEAINAATVWHRASERQLTYAREGASFIATLEQDIPTVYSLPTFVEKLVDKHQRRLAIDVARRLVKVAEDESAPAGQLLEDSENVFRQLRNLTAPSSLTVKTASELITEEINNNDNLLGDRLLARGQSLTLLGAGGIGKSRLLLQLAACSITGRPFLGIRGQVPDLKWLIFQTENSKRRLQADLQRLRQWLGSEWDRVAGRLFLHTVEETNDCFVQLDLPGVRTKLSNVIERIDPDVICFDPLNAFGVGDLNRDSDMRESCQALTQICAEGRADRAIVVLHHALTGKSGAARATGFDRSSFGRNSKLLQAWTRAQINLAPVSGTDNTRLVVSCGKCSNGQEFEPFAIKLSPETMIYEVEPEFDQHAWQRQLVEGNTRTPEDDLLDICIQPITRKEAVRKLLDKGHSQAAAYRIVKESIDEGLVRLEGTWLHRVEQD